MTQKVKPRVRIIVARNAQPLSTSSGGLTGAAREQRVVGASPAPLYLRPVLFLPPMPPTHKRAQLSTSSARDESHLSTGAPTGAATGPNETKDVKNEKDEKEMVMGDGEMARRLSQLLLIDKLKKGEYEWWQGQVVEESGKENYSVAYHDVENKTWYFPCPRCYGVIQMLQSELNCRIFRHGEINPHANQQTCDQFVRDTQLKRGCGTPLRFDNGTVRITSYNS